MTSNEKQQETETVEAPTATTRIHVTNLPWTFTDEQLTKLFSEAGKVTKASIVTRTNGESKGFGFVEYESAEGSKKAIEELNNKAVEKRRIGVVFSTSQGPYKPTEPRDYEDGEPSTRLHVRQLKWGVKKKDLQEAFGKYGKLTSCQLVKNKRSGRPRGYGFVEFATEEEATKAKEALNKSTLQDREIVVLFSKSTGPRKTKQRRKKASKTKKEEKTDEAPVEKTEGKKKNNAKKKKKNTKNKKKSPPKQEPKKDNAAADGKNEEDRPVHRKKRLYVKNLGETTTEEQLTTAFGAHGDVEKVVLLKNKQNELRGFAYIQFQDADAASKAKEALHESEIADSKVEVYWAQQRKFRRRRGGKGGKKPNNKDK